MLTFHSVDYKMVAVISYLHSSSVSATSWNVLSYVSISSELCLPSLLSMISLKWQWLILLKLPSWKNNTSSALNNSFLISFHWYQKSTSSLSFDVTMMTSESRKTEFYRFWRKIVEKSIFSTKNPRNMQFWWGFRLI